LLFLLVLFVGTASADDLARVDLPGADAAMPVKAFMGVAVDDLTVAPSERRARLTVALDNAGAEVDIALCPMLSFLGSLRTAQGYRFSGAALGPECTAALDAAPGISLTLDALQGFPPQCPAPAPSDLGDIVTLPAASSTVLVYEFLLADLGAGLEALSAADVRHALMAGGGIRAETVTPVPSGPGGETESGHLLVCPSGVDSLLAEKVAETIGTGSSRWYKVHMAAPGAVVVSSSLSSAATLGLVADVDALVELHWEDNLATPLAGHLAHDPAPAVAFPLGVAALNSGTLTATFPTDLPEGFVGRATVVVNAADQSGELARSVHLFILDTLPPEITAASTVRGESDLDVAVAAEDGTSPLNAARLTVSDDGAFRPTGLMDLTGGTLDGPSTFGSLVDGTDPAESIGALAAVSDEAGNDVMATLPVAGAGEDRVEECDSFDGATVTLDGSLSTYPPASEASTTFTWTNGFGTATGETVDVTLALGDHDVTLTLEDSRAFTGTDMAQIGVVDTTPPVIDLVATDPTCLWPPNHKYVRFFLDENLFVSASDVCDPEVDIRVLGVESNQPDNGKGDGNTINDVVYSSGGFCIRSERSGRGRWGRVYTAYVEATDDSGNASQGMVTVRVPHDQRPSMRCDALDPALFLADDDPACAPESLTLPGEEPVETLPDNVRRRCPRGAEGRECREARRAARLAERRADQEARRAERLLRRQSHRRGGFTSH
jgi:hypothetical protein